MNSAEAFAAIALAAVACDGRLGRDEAHALRAQLEYRSVYRSSSDAEMGDLFDQLLHRLRDQGVIGLVDEALPVLSLAQQQSALAVALPTPINSPRRISVLRTWPSEWRPDGERILVAIEALNRDSLDG